MLSGRAELWDGQWESEIRERISVEGCDNYWAHPVWTQEVKDMDRRSVDDALRLVGILPPGNPKPRCATQRGFQRNAQGRNARCAWQLQRLPGSLRSPQEHTEARTYLISTLLSSALLTSSGPIPIGEHCYLRAHMQIVSMSRGQGCLML